ncbi:MAG: hypothetical protein WBC33_07190 [Conexibacter sp.]
MIYAGRARVRTVGEAAPVNENARLEMGKLLAAGLADNDAQSARETYCQTVTRAFKVSGEMFDLAGHALHDENAQALALVARIGAALGQGACDLLTANNPYAAAALIRQLVEVEYLLWTFADDITDASAWLHASRSERMQRFSPRVMRKRSQGRFRDREYQTHCERGGHPDPDGRVLLDGLREFDVTRSMWADLGHHLERAWGLFMAASATSKYLGDYLSGGEAVETERRRWHERDKLAERLPAPPWAT